MTFNNLKGKIFIEAFSDKEVIYAISGMTNTYQNSIQVIPINERIKIFEYDKFQNINIKINQLVRVKNGNYKGDLAKIVHVQKPQNIIYIALLPRILENVENKNSFNVAPFSKMKSNIISRQKIFDDKKYGGETTKIQKIFGDCLKFGKYIFMDGLLIIPTKITSLETQNVNPKEEELQILKCYNDENGIYRDKNNENELLISKNIIKNYKKGDKIKFTSGKYKGISGTIITITGNKIKARLELNGLPQEYECPISMITIDYNYKLGEIVYVKNGNNKGKNGIIIKILDNNYVTLYDEVNQSKFIAKNSDLELKNNIIFDNEENSIFKAGDLITIKNTNIICYIIESTKLYLKVITERNEIKKIAVKEAEKIKINKDISNIDINGNTIKTKNVVKIIDGQYKGKKAKIKCIYKKYVFLHNNSFKNTNGIFCDICGNVELLGSEMLNNNEKGNTKDIIPKDIIGKKFNVIKGMWKGYTGIAVDVNHKYIKLELLAKQKTIQLSIDDIIKVNDNFDNNNKLEVTGDLSNQKPPSYLSNDDY